MIEVTDLTKRYGEIHALRGVTFTIRPGEVVGLLGPNGAGKSTAMRIVTGYLAPTSGSARVNGREVADDRLAAQRAIGYLPEGNPVYGELRLIEALRFQATMRGLRGAERQRAIAAAMEAAGLSGMGRRLIATFSRGYQQRVGLAQALLHEPPILILDEPSSGLDPNQQVEMRALLRRLGEERTVVFSSHILPEVQAVCDRVLVIHRGRLVAEGSVGDLEAQAGLAGAVDLTVRAAQADAVERALLALAFVARARRVDPAADGAAGVGFEVEVRGRAGADELEALAGAVTAAGGRLLGLARRAHSLDRVFRALTLEAPEHPDAPLPAAAAPLAARAE